MLLVLLLLLASVGQQQLDATLLSQAGGEPSKLPSSVRYAARGARRGGMLCTAHAACPEGHFCESVYRKCSKCAECRFHGDAVDFLCPRDRCVGAPHIGGEDDLAPMLRSFSVAPSQVDVAGAQKRVFVSMSLEVVDDLSGLKVAKLEFSSRSQSSRITTYIFDSLEAPLTSKQGWKTLLFEGSFWFETLDEGGPWKVTSVVLQDHAANARCGLWQNLYILPCCMRAYLKDPVPVSP
jgi:hypothetical protein